MRTREVDAVDGISVACIDCVSIDISLNDRVSILSSIDVHVDITRCRVDCAAASMCSINRSILLSNVRQAVVYLLYNNIVSIYCISSVYCVLVVCMLVSDLLVEARSSCVPGCVLLWAL